MQGGRQVYPRCMRHILVLCTTKHRRCYQGHWIIFTKLIN